MSDLRPSLVFLLLGSALAFSYACSGGDDDDDGAATPNTNTNTPASVGNPGGSSSTGSTDAGVSPLGGLGSLFGDAGLEGFFGEGGISLDPNLACSAAPQLCPDGSIDFNAVGSAACSFSPALCADGGAGAGGNFIGNLGGIFGGGTSMDAGGGPGGTSDAGSQPPDAGNGSSSDAGSASDAASSGDASDASGDAS